MNKLVKEIIKPIIEADSDIKKIVAIYPGRFQPFGLHHKKVYDFLKKKFDDVYITTSDIKKPPKHPMNFKEKARHMTKMGIPSSKIINERSPYRAEKALKKFDSTKTAVVYAVGKKDAGRLSSGKYFKDFNSNKNNLEGYREKGYVLQAPHFSINVGGKEISGTVIRNLLGSPNIEDNEREKLFKQAFGYFNTGIYNMLTNKFKKLYETEESDSIDEDINIPLNIGDTVLMGKFKNKKVVVKTIDWNEKGDLLINGRSAMKMRLLKKVNIFDSDITEEQILNFILNTDLSKMIKEVSNVAASGIHAVDDGPRYWWGNQKSYRASTDKQARKLGFRVVNYILGNEELPIYDTKYPDGPTGKVSYFPVGKAGAKAGTSVMADAIGPKAYQMWITHIKRVSEILGYKIVDFLNADFSIEGSKDEPISYDDPKSEAPPDMELRDDEEQHEDYEKVEEQIFTKKWWKNILVEETSRIAAGEPDTGYTHPGKKRYLHPSDMPEGMYQTEFPIADDPYGAGDEQQRMYIKIVKDKKELETPIPSDDSVTVGIGGKGEDFVKSVNIEDFPAISKDIEEDIAFTKKWWKSLLLEGGAYGHMAHPFDDWGLTFKDLKNIIELGLSGRLNREDNVSEKLDGQNLMVSWKDGKLIAARNKGHLKNAGESAVDIKGMMTMFKGRGEIYNAFVFAVKDLQKAIGGLSKKQQDKIFMNGKAFMNLEVMWPKSANVVNYDLTQLVFHGAIEYNDAGTPVGEVKGSAGILEGMIRQVNQHVQKHYKIGKPQFLNVPKNQDFASRKTYYFKKLQKFQNQYAMNDSDTFGLYHQRYWEEFINNAAKQMKYNISNKILQNLVKRWAFHDKSYKISQIKNDIKDDKFLDWILSFDKNDHAKFVKSNMKPFELLFFELGAEILKNVSGFLTVNPNKSVQAMKKQVDKAVSSIRSGGNIEKIKKLKAQLEKLNSIGGMDAIVPSEGLVFKYGGKTYKFTGAFAPVNQIIGMLKFSR
tara:strand:+ start:807 stop:3785 length:2979 start_codon:yes stop_codon:yes gene_type:complete